MSRIRLYGGLLVRTVTMMNGDWLTDVSSEDILYLLLLETTPDDEPPCTIYTPCRPHFGE